MAGESEHLNVLAVATDTVDTVVLISQEVLLPVQAKNVNCTRMAF
jgi:hypothetical protein